MKKVLLLGGSGFVGSVLAGRLSAAGNAVLIPTRRRERCKALTLLPRVELVEADIHEAAVLPALMRDCDAVVNLVGILHGAGAKKPYGADFARAHVELPEKIVSACRQTGIRRLLHMSALKADPAGPSGYLASKGEGEGIVRAAGGALQVTVFRPSVIFGAGDAFLNTFVRVHRLSPFFPLGFGQAKLQPVWVEDVASAFASALENPATAGQAYDLCGPQVYTLRELVEYAARWAGRRAPVVPLCRTLARLQAGVMGLAPQPLLSLDNLRSLQVDSICDAACAGFPGWKPAALEAVAPSYLQAGQSDWDRLRTLAGR